MKYIVLEAQLGDLKQKIPIIFPKFLVHADIAVAFANLLRRKYDREVTHNNGKVSVLSAGEIYWKETTCGGKSETCHVESKCEEDAMMIQMYDYFHGLDT